MWRGSVRRRKNRNKLLTAEMDYLLRSCRRTRLERIRNETVREMMKMERDIIGQMHKRHLIRFGHTNRTHETRWPRKVQEWLPREKRKGGRRKRGWRDGMKEAMEARDLAEGDCCKREE
jgi:hypothetical protein